MLRAMSSAGLPGRMRETPPLRTLLTYFVPSGMIDETVVARLRRVLGLHQLTGWRERQHLVVADVDDDDVALRVEGDAIGLAQRRTLHEDRRRAVRRDLPDLPGRRIRLLAASPVCVA